MTNSVLLRIPLALVALALLNACATAPRVTTHSMPQVDFTAYETFGWVDELGTDRGGYETHITQYFKSATRREMEALGYRYVEENPDLLVNFFARTEERQDVYAHPTASALFATGYYGYRYGMYTAWPVYTTEIDTFDYTVGTANIDLIDAEANRMIWEGRIEGRLTEQALDEPADAISDAVAEIFEQFPTRTSER